MLHIPRIAYRRRTIPCLHQIWLRTNACRHDSCRRLDVGFLDKVGRRDSRSAQQSSGMERFDAVRNRGKTTTPSSGLQSDNDNTFRFLTNDHHDRQCHQYAHPGDVHPKHAKGAGVARRDAIHPVVVLVFDATRFDSNAVCKMSLQITSFCQKGQARCLQRRPMCCIMTVPRSKTGITFYIVIKLSGGAIAKISTGLPLSNGLSYASRRLLAWIQSIKSARSQTNLLYTRRPRHGLLPAEKLLCSSFEMPHLNPAPSS